MIRKGSTRRAGEALLSVVGNSSSNPSSGRTSPMVDGAASPAGSSSGKPAKTSTFRAATHIGSVVDDWPMYSAQASDYVLGPAIGFGASSVVYQASFLPLDGRPCAVKVIELEAFGRDMAELRRETQLMSLSKHPNVLRVRGCWVEGSKLHIATRFMSSGSILDIMRFSYPDGLEESVIATVLKQALDGLNYLHINGWLHRDLKAANMLVDEDGTVLLGDFGVGVYLDEGSKPTSKGSTSDQSNKEDSADQAARKSFVGTPCWMAPEVVERKSYGTKADIWSFGITALELSSGRAPHSRLPPVKVLMRTLQDEPPTLDRKSGAYKYSKIFDDFVKQCLQKDPNKRPSAQQLLGHAFFKQARSSKHLVNTILAGLPPLAERQQQARHMSIASLHNNMSWDFNTTMHGTGSRMTTPFHERIDPFHNFSGVVASPRGSVRSSWRAGAKDASGDHPDLDTSENNLSLTSGLPRRSRSPSIDDSTGQVAGPPLSKSSWSSRRRSRTQRSNVSLDIHEEGGAEGDDLPAELVTAQSGSSIDQLANSTGDLTDSTTLPPIEEVQVASTPPLQETQQKDLDDAFKQAATPPLVPDSTPSSKADSLELGSDAEQNDFRPAQTAVTTAKASPQRSGRTREAFSKLFKRPN